MNALRKLLSKITGYFTGGRAASDFKKVEDVVFEVAPFIQAAVDIAARMVPSPTLGIAFAAIQRIEAKYPALFNGSVKTEDERKLYLLGIAGDLVQNQFPHLDTSTARAAIQLAFIGVRT